MLFIYSCLTLFLILECGTCERNSDQEISDRLKSIWFNQQPRELEQSQSSYMKSDIITPPHTRAIPQLIRNIGTSSNTNSIPTPTGRYLYMEKPTRKNNNKNKLETSYDSDSTARISPNSINGAWFIYYAPAQSHSMLPYCNEEILGRCVDILTSLLAPYPVAKKIGDRIKVTWLRSEKNSDTNVPESDRILNQKGREYENDDVYKATYAGGPVYLERD